VTGDVGKSWYRQSPFFMHLLLKMATGIVTIGDKVFLMSLLFLYLRN